MSQPSVAPTTPAQVPAGYPTPGPGTAISRPCYSCGREWGTAISCQFCGQLPGLPPGVQLSSAGRRLGGYLLELVLGIFTLGIGWLIWALIVFKDGQTPAKQILGMRVVKLRDNAKASWGTMFLREFIVRPVFTYITLGIAALWLLWDANKQELWDKALGTVVVDDPNRVLAPASGSPAQAGSAPLPPTNPGLAPNDERPALPGAGDSNAAVAATGRPAAKKSAASRGPAKKAAPTKAAASPATSGLKKTAAAKKAATKKAVPSAATPSAKKAVAPKKAVPAAGVAKKALPATKKSAAASKKTTSRAAGGSRARKA